MAAVYSEKECSLQSNNENLSSEHAKRSAQDVNIDPVSNSKASNARNTGGEMEICPRGPKLKAQDHAEVVGANAAFPPMKIKTEQVEEDECVVVHVDEVEEGDLADIFTSTGDSSERDGSTEGDRPFHCEDCSEAFGNKEDYLEHRSEHIHDGPIVCLDTDSQWDDLLISTDGGRRTLFCALCGQKFSSSKGFFTHQLKHRNQDIKQGAGDGFGEGAGRQKLFECKDCGKAYTTVGQCLNHQRSHKQASKSVFHQLAHLKKKSFQCPTCGRCYSRASALDAHRRCHEVKLVKSKTCETEKPMPLNESPGQTEDNGTSSEQPEGHEQKVFQCFCGKSFRAMCGLSTHKRFSTSCSDGKVKEEIKHSFVCSECGKTFVSSVALLCHQRWHKRRAQLVCNGEPYKCTECGKVFTSLTFYNKHQRLAHSEELPAKSFLHQVIQLKKKAFECPECGRRFSRASALQSHQLCHTDVFGDIMEKKPEMSTATHTLKINQNDNADSVVIHSVETSHAQVQKKDFNLTDTVEEDGAIDVDYEVVHITASDDYENNSGFSRDQNPDLELVCESDQEEKDDLGFNLSQTAESTSSLQLNPEIDVKIVQIDYEHLNDEPLTNAQLLSKSRPQEAKYNCPHCDRKFVKGSSLRCHILWHKGCMGKKSDRRQKFNVVTPTKKELLTCNVFGHESPSKSADCFNTVKHEDKVAYKSISYQLENLQKNNIKCEECGMCFSRLSALHSHQQHHDRKKKTFACVQCDKSYTTPSGLYNHLKVCSGGAKDEKRKNFNPTKSLLGPKVYHCKKCGKGFWSLGAFCHHKQNHSECAHFETRAPGTPDTENCHIRRKKRGRRGGYRRVHPMNSREEHVCEVCGKSYHMLGCFLKHKLVHDTQPAVKSFDYQVQQLKKNSYQCPDCAKVFSRAMALQFHMKSHGFETGLPLMDSDSSERPQCPTCYSFFASESILQNHQKHCVKPQDNVELPQECFEREEQDTSSRKAKDVVDTSHSKDSKKEQNTPLASDLKYKCQECSRSFSVIGALNFHKRIHRKGHQSKKLKSNSAKPLKLGKGKPEKCLAKSPFVCAECGRYFSTNSALGTHKRWHKDKKFARFLSKTNKIHSKKSVDGGPYLCNVCGKGFFYLCVLRRHQLHHPTMQTQPQKEHEVAETNGVFTCPDCQMSFSSGSLLTSHFADHHSKPTETEKRQSEILSADESGPPVKLLYASKMDVAKREKAEVKHFQCSYCDKSFLNIRGLRAHKWQKHHKVSERPTASQEERSAFVKPFASEGPLRKTSSKKELKASTEEDPVQHNRNFEFAKCFFKCDKCAKAFPSEEQLNAHKEVAKTRPHCCALCCRGYWTENQLQHHLAWHNEVRRRLPTELRYRLSASLAPGPSDNQQALSHRSESTVKLPVALVCPQANSHKCQQCGKTFLSPRALQQHQTLHKDEEPYHCSLCSQTFSDLRNLIDHHQECLGDKELKDSSSVSEVRDAANLTCIECGISFKQETELHQHYIEHARGF
ncbi:zinc finger protein 208 isoform X3 [Pimephales promelas]|uniref:zinc finger protein 208 isoform X2 n=1 Tax=Pimephales promelas TaxID=90988 RepID=UPI0019559000|nr:zinc finger protein 208 isoform X2 [Pimephales promelas]XP_039536180.1 zinc finger protein 208 isoform X3 [Pimephales promelas]